MWENHREDADWFIKADDDTFVIMENLKYKTSVTFKSYEIEMLLRNLLVDYDPEEPMIFGHRFKYFGVSEKDIKPNSVFILWSRL